ncbi:MAG: hypothetical protein J7499_05450 [Sphingopyxis sp.]|nr:hypothetical protein [Sphingopyxis sp.]
MILPLLLMFVAPPEAPCEYCAAIFDDVRLNAMIGNGNLEVSSEWAGGRHGDDVSIRIEDLNCPESRKRRKCSFTLRRMLIRNGIEAADPTLPERLRCMAMVKWFDSGGDAGWGVEHSPPRRDRGHSTRSMTCKRIETGA